MMCRMDTVIQNILKEILPTLDQGKLVEVASAITVAGIIQEQDLYWVGEDDVKHVLPPVQVRKLIGGLKTKYGEWCQHLSIVGLLSLFKGTN